MSTATATATESTLLNVFIIEDEKPNQELLQDYLHRYCEGIAVTGIAESVEDGLTLINSAEQRPDIVFMDIQLKDGLVFQLLKQLEVIDFEIIFVTAHDRFMLRAFDYNAIGYVMKPVDTDKLVEAVTRARQRGGQLMQQRMDNAKQSQEANVFKKMSISALDGIYFINIEDIVRCEGEDNYTHIFLEDGRKITVSKTIKEYDRLLSPNNFFRVHKSHLINLNYMVQFVRGDGGYIIMHGDKQIEVSRRRRPLLMERLRERMA